MNRLSSFFSGVIVGAIGLYVGMTYHIVRAEDGAHMIPKVAAGLGDAYVDIRQFDGDQWNEHRNVAIAIVSADKDDLLKDSTLSNFRQTAQTALESLGLK